MSLDTVSDFSSDFGGVTFTDVSVSSPSPSTDTQSRTETILASAEAIHSIQSLELPPPALIAILVAVGLLAGICTLFVVLHVRRWQRHGPRKKVIEYITPLSVPPLAGEAWVSRLSMSLENGRPVRVMPALPERSWRREGRQARRDLATKSVFGLGNPPPYTLTSEV